MVFPPVFWLVHQTKVSICNENRTIAIFYLVLLYHFNNPLFYDVQQIHIIFFPCVSTEGEYIKMFMRGRPITMFIPSDVDNYDDIRTELPPEKLKLEWVYPFLS